MSRENTGAPYRVGLCHCLDCRGRFFCPRCCSPVFGRSGDEIEVDLGATDASDQIKPTCELWTIRRESWLPPTR